MASNMRQINAIHFSEWLHGTYECGLWSRTLSATTSYVTSDKFFNLSKPLFSLLKYADRTLQP